MSEKEALKEIIGLVDAWEWFQKGSSSDVTKRGAGNKFMVAIKEILDKMEVEAPS